MKSGERSNDRPLLSVVVPAFNESENLPVFYERLCAALAGSDVDWEWIVVDDHSSDDTFAVVEDLAARDDRVSGVRLARNHGSFSAIVCGLERAGGDCAVVLAADLQDPPEVIPELLSAWRGGGRVVWAARRQRHGEKATTLLFARAYYFLMRHVVGLKQLPSRGADFFLLDRQAYTTLCRFKERNISLVPLLNWMGFSQRSIEYDKQARLHGESGWSLGKKIKLVADSVTSFSFLPIRLMSYIGFAVALAGFAFAGVVIVEALFGNPVSGYPSLMVAVLVIGGIQMMMMGILGEYVWRTFDEVRARPRFLVERSVNGSPAHAADDATGAWQRPDAESRVDVAAEAVVVP